MTILAYWTAHVASLSRLSKLLRYALATTSIYGICGYGSSGPAPKFVGANSMPGPLGEIWTAMWHVESVALQHLNSLLAPSLRLLMSLQTLSVSINRRQH